MRRRKKLLAATASSEAASLFVSYSMAVVAILRDSPASSWKQRWASPPPTMNLHTAPELLHAWVQTRIPTAKCVPQGDQKVIALSHGAI